MASRQAESRLGRSVGSQLVGHQYVRRKALLLEQSAHELRSRSGVAPPLHEKIENLAFVIDRSPEPEPSAADQNRHFIEMPTRGWPRTSAAKFLGEQRPELQHPIADRFVRDIQPALGEQIFDTVVPAEYAPQAIGFSANALNSRGILGTGNPRRFVRTSWWS